MEKIEEELHAIIFMYKTDKSLYDRIIKENENDLLEGKDTFPKMFAETCWILGRWKNKYGNELYIRFGRCKEDSKAILAKQGIIEPTTAQLKNATEKVEEELHAIIFMYKTDK